MPSQQLRHLVICAAFIVVYVIVTGSIVAMGPDVTPDLLTLQLTSYNAFALVAALLIRRFGFESPWKARPGLGWMVAASLASAILVLLVRFFIKQPPVGWQLKSAQDWRDIAQGYLVGRMMVPLAEELFFRGLLLTTLNKSLAIRPYLAVFIGAFVFGILHWPPLYGLSPLHGFLEVFSAFVAGLAFGFLTNWTRSIVPGLALHIIGNSIGF